MLVLSRDSTIALGPEADGGNDPTLVGATVRVLTAAGDTFDATYELPAAGWKRAGKAGAAKAYRYLDPALEAGPIRAAAFKDGKLIRIVGLGENLRQTLGVEPDPTMVVLSIGDHRYCMAFGGRTAFHAGKRYTAHDAPPPEACP